MFSQPQQALAYTHAACALMAAALRCRVVSAMLGGGGSGFVGGGSSSLAGGGGGDSIGGGTYIGCAHAGHRESKAQHQTSSTTSTTTISTDKASPAASGQAPAGNAVQQSSTPHSANTPTSHACTHELVSVSSAVCGLWPLAQRTFILRLLNQMYESDRGQNAVSRAAYFALKYQYL